MQNILIKKRYELYLLSLIILLFGQSFSPAGYEAFWQHFIVIQNVLIGLTLFTKSAKWVLVIVSILSAILISECILLLWIDNILVRFTMGLVFTIYFLMASLKVYRDVLKAKEVGHEMIAAVFSGFIMLGFLGSFLFTLIELTYPGSFHNLGNGETKFQDITYFSFVSLLTIGYGDIVPFSQIAKNTSIFLGLAGNFYLTFITAVIIGKYLNRELN